MCSSISFSKEDMNYLNSLKEMSMSAFPNPVTGNKFNVRFRSENTKTLQLKLTDAVTGKIILTKQVNASRGENIVPVEMNSNEVHKIMIVNLDGTGVDNSKYKPIKIMAGARYGERNKNPARVDTAINQKAVLVVITFLPI